MTRRKDSGVELPATTRDATKKAVKRKRGEVHGAKKVVLQAIGYPFRIQGEPKPLGLEIDSKELFADYVREQWLGSIVRSGMYLFDRYVMPDFAFQIVKAEPENSVVTKDTQIVLQQDTSPPPIVSRYTLEDVVGQETVKRKCQLILRYLEDPQQFGEWSPRAVLFHGPPGTGKTMTAKALVHEANAKMFYTKAAELIGIHVGDGGRRISALFDSARKQAPSIVFIDELDAIGLARSFQSIRGDVSEVVTALLGEFDRIDETPGVVIIGATNALHLIDPAIRSRFDAVFEFKLPNLEERIAILRMYAKKLPIPLDVEIEFLASITEGLSGRDLRDKLLKETLHIAISEEMRSIPQNVVLDVLKNIKTEEPPDYLI